MRGERVVTEGCPNPGEFVGGDRRADSAAADENPTLGLLVFDRPSDSLGEIRVVVTRNELVCTTVEHLVTCRANGVADAVLERKARVIRSERDDHLGSVTCVYTSFEMSAMSERA